MSEVEIEAISLTINNKKLRLKLHDAKALYEQLKSLFGSEARTPYVSVPTLLNTQPHPPIPLEATCRSITSDPTPPLPNVYCGKDTGKEIGENTSGSYS